MSDETKMNPELENFAASLRQIDAPEANINRDQLMYDAGWAAAMAQGVSGSSVQRSGYGTVAMSFASGVSLTAVAAALLLLAFPFAGQPSVSLQTDNQVASVTPVDVSPVDIAPVDAVAADSSEKPDLMEWIDSVPQGHSLASGFSSRPVMPELADVDETSKRSINQNGRQSTAQSLMQELMPRAQPRDAMTGWASLIINNL